MTTETDYSAIRGAIGTSITVSTENLIAGQPFSIFVKVTNPFEIPISIHRVSTSLPTELVDLNQALREREAAELEARLREINDAGKLVGLESNLHVPPKKRAWYSFLEGMRVSFYGADFEFRNQGHLGQAVARDLGSATSVVEAGVGLPGLVSMTTTTRKIGSGESSEEKARWREQLKKEQERHEAALENLAKPTGSPTILQAGNSTVRSFTLRSKGHIWFRPAPYKLHMEIGYEISGVKHVAAIEFNLQLRASLSSMVAGSLIGSTAGWFIARSEAFDFGLSTLISWTVSAILGAMSVVVFARKKDVQPIIAVEDFWGGVALGFLVAYSGPTIIGEILPDQGALPLGGESGVTGG